MERLQWNKVAKWWFTAKGQKGTYNAFQFDAVEHSHVSLNGIRFKNRRFKSLESAKKFAEKYDQQ